MTHSRDAAVTVGTFDGVHRGHWDVFRQLTREARERDLRSVAVTFEPHPLEIVNPSAAPPALASAEEKREIIAETGIDELVVLPFTPALAALEAEQFIDLLSSRMQMRHLVIGHDHGFGRQRAGNATTLAELAGRRGFSLSVVPPTLFDGVPISSTAIRRAIAGGDLDKAAHILGRPYSVAGRVVKGAGRGRTIGFPTINVHPFAARKLLPPDGVYAVRAGTPLGSFGGMMNIGGKPTFDDNTRSVEANLFDVPVGSDLYGCAVRIDFVSSLRATRRFPSPEALVEQLRADEIAARSALTAPRAPANLKG